ncbi:MAG: DUF924 domain-containing protein [Gammaproteobacteria bacterium]|jgi:uncharacterized protein (DUF924 family)|nr:DUF924 domain-containing protein [Gammaproteobacteria bacterium]MBT3725523.1 DUF924 domain-containing protein [Gammaproteobacteria bacterium]MBT4194682.1 DUF924 domain-containing protein [Gammaproteobacteria bacterium]MBT4452327.1 DUF924 domain-containing protein [Gammaproteobacteria bacterium]MBT4862851.1 DUF924 domain-containing protein [Gammaproteobacteria bacterium]
MKKDDDLIQEILEFWFSKQSRSKWFNSTPEFDEVIRQRFEKVWGQARADSFDHWEQEPDGALALVIIFDQLPLNMFRQDARQYSTEAHARRIATHAIQQGFDQDMDKLRKSFFYLPFMHSESIEDQDRSVELYEKAGLDDNLRYAKHHRDVVKRFGRFPHRNEALGRESSEEELEYLKTANW